MALNENIVREQNARIDAITHTPTFLVVAGALPGLYAATSFENGLIIGLVTAVAIEIMALLAPALKAFTGTWSRSAVMLTVGAAVVTLCGFAVRIISPLVFESLGIYLPLVAVNALVVAFIVGDGPVLSDDKNVYTTASFASMMIILTLGFIGFINGMFATGQVFGLTMNELAASPIAVFGTPAGSLLVLALVAVFVQSIEQAPAKAAAAKAKAEAEAAAEQAAAAEGGEC